MTVPPIAGSVTISVEEPFLRSPGQISEQMPPAAFENIAPDSDGFLWIRQDKFHDSFCQDLTADEALVMAVTQKAPLGSTFGDMAERMNPRETIELAASHASLASQPDAIVDLIEDAVRELS